MSERELYEAMPRDLLGAIAAGHHGLALMPGSERAPLMLVCVAPRDRLDALTAVSVTVGTHAAPLGGAEGRIVVVRVGRDAASGEPTRPTDDRMCIGIDIGHPDGRRLAARMADSRGIPLMKVASESRRLTARELVTFGDDCATALRRALARAGEWHTEAPPPLGFSEEDWRRLAAGGPGPRLFAASGAGDLVMALAAPAGFRGVDLDRRPASVHSVPHADGTGSRAGGTDLELRFMSPIGEDTRVLIHLDGESQRGLAERMCARPGLVVLSLDGGGRSTLSGCVRIDLTPTARALVRRAVAAARARDDPYPGSAGR